MSSLLVFDFQSFIFERQLQRNSSLRMKDSGMWRGGMLEQMKELRLISFRLVPRYSLSWALFKVKISRALPSSISRFLHFPIASSISRFIRILLVNLLLLLHEILWNRNRSEAKYIRIYDMTSSSMLTWWCFVRFNFFISRMLVSCHRLLWKIIAHNVALICRRV